MRIPVLLSISFIFVFLGSVIGEEVMLSPFYVEVNIKQDSGFFPSGSSGGGSSGGSFGGGLRTENFSGKGIILNDSFKGINIGEERIEVFLRKGEIKIKEINIENFGEPVNITIFIGEGIREIVNVSKDFIFLAEREVRKLKLEFRALENVEPKWYYGDLIFESGGFTDEVFVAVKVEDADLNKDWGAYYLFIALLIGAGVFLLWNYFKRKKNFGARGKGFYPNARR